MITNVEELFVFYGSDFFEEGNSNCKCPFANLHRTADVQPVSYTHAAIQRKTSLIDSNFLNSISRKRLRNFVQKRSREMTKFAKVRNFSSSSSGGVEPEIHFAQSRADHNDEQLPRQLEENRLEIPPHFLISTPNFSEIENLEVGDSSEIVPRYNNDAAVEPSCYGSSSEDEAVPSESPNSKFEACVSFILEKHATPDAEADEWIKLIRELNPTQIIPSYNSLKRKYHLTHAEQAKFLKVCGLGHRWMLDFTNEIVAIVKENTGSIFAWGQMKEDSTDFKPPTSADYYAKVLRIFLILNSYGVKIMKSASKSIWSVWLAIANLPQKKRASFENIVLAALVLGDTKPQWNDIFEVIIFTLLKILNAR